MVMQEEKNRFFCESICPVFSRVTLPTALPLGRSRQGFKGAKTHFNQHLASEREDAFLSRRPTGSSHLWLSRTKGFSSIDTARVAIAQDEFAMALLRT
jgi:hypothetical protein